MPVAITEPFLGIAEISDLRAEIESRRASVALDCDFSNGRLCIRPGLVSLATLGAGPVRGFFEWRGFGAGVVRILAASGTGLYMFDGATWELLGSPFSAGRSVVQFAALGGLVYATDGESPLVVTDGTATYAALLPRPDEPTVATSPATGNLVIATPGGQYGTFGFRFTWYSPSFNQETLASDEAEVTLAGDTLTVRVDSADAPDARFTKFRVYRRAISGGGEEWFRLYRPGTPHTDWSFDTDYTFDAQEGAQVDEGARSPLAADIENQHFSVIATHGPILLAVDASRPEVVYFSDANPEAPVAFYGTRAIGSVGSGDDILRIHTTEQVAFVQKSTALYALTGYTESTFDVTKVADWTGRSRGGQSASGSRLYSIGTEGLRVVSENFEDSVVSRPVQERIFQAVDYGDISVFTSIRCDVVGVAKRGLSAAAANVFVYQPAASRQAGVEIWAEWRIPWFECALEADSPADGTRTTFVGLTNGQVCRLARGEGLDGVRLRWVSRDIVIAPEVEALLKEWKTFEVGSQRLLSPARLSVRSIIDGIELAAGGTEQIAGRAIIPVLRSSRRAAVVLQSETDGEVDVSSLIVNFQVLRRR